MWFGRIIILFFIIASFRIGYLQFVKGPDIIENEIIANRVKEITNIPERGTITDKNNNTLALSYMSQDIALNPNLIVSNSHKEKIATLLSENIDGLSYEEVMEVVNSTSKYKVVAKRVSPEVAKIIRNSGLGGIQIAQSPTRVYPNGAIGGTFLGLVNDENEPNAGVEIKLNKFLSGTKGYTIFERTPFGDTIPIGTQNYVTPVNGQNVQLTIDINLQKILEENMALAVEELEPEQIHAVLMEPSTGKILSMTSYPSYDPNEYQKYDKSTWTNTPANFAYEPGSTIKPIVVVNALNQGAITTEETFPTGTRYVNGAKISDWNRGQGFGNVKAKDVLRNSSNIGMMAIGQKMGRKGMIEAFERAGIGRKTGVELPGEEGGFNVPTVKALEDDPIREANVTFGQGVMSTPVQMIAAISEIANGGYDITPTLLEKVTDNSGNDIYTTEVSKERLYSEEAALATKEMMKYTYENYSSDYHIEGFDGGAKTGSAWYVENGGYAKGKIIGSFVGFVPYDNPQYAMIISVKNPQGAEYGSTAAGPMWQKTMSEILAYEHVKPTKSDSASDDEQGEDTEEEVEEAISYKVPNTEWLLVNTAKTTIQKALGSDVTVRVSGNGDVVVDQEYVVIDNQLIVTLLTKPLLDKNTLYMPNLVGEKRTTIEELFESNKVNYKIYGSNQLVEQNIEIGKQPYKEKIILWFK